MFIVCSIVLMIVWMFLYCAFHVSAFVSGSILTVAFGLFGCDWWLHSRCDEGRDGEISGRRRLGNGSVSG